MIKTNVLAHKKKTSWITTP